MKKRLFVGIVMVCLVFLCMPITALAEEQASDEVQVIVSPKKAKIFSTIDIGNESMEAGIMLDALLEDDAITYEGEFIEVNRIADEMKQADLTEIVEKFNTEIRNINPAHVDLEAKDITFHICPYPELEITGVEYADEYFQGMLIIEWKTFVKYDVIATSNGGDTVEIETKIPLVMEEGTMMKFSFPLLSEVGNFLEVLTIKQFHDDGTVRYYRTAPEAGGTVTFSVPVVGKFAMIVDERTVTVKYVDLDEEKNYDVTSINTETLPTATKEGYTFKGWKMEPDQSEMIYQGTLTEEILNQMHEWAISGHEPIYATAVFERETVEQVPETNASNDDDTHEDFEKENVTETELAVCEGVSEQEVAVTKPAKTSDGSMAMFYVAVMIVSIISRFWVKRCAKAIFKGATQQNE